MCNMHITTRILHHQMNIDFVIKFSCTEKKNIMEYHLIYSIFIIEIEVISDISIKNVHIKASSSIWPLETEQYIIRWHPNNVSLSSLL